MKHVTLTNIEKGKIGEEFAQALYRKARFEIAETDLRMGRSQVDFVAKRDGIYAFVEVKFRQSLDEAHAAIQAGQFTRIARVAEKYMFDKSSPWQLDALLIDKHMNWHRIDNIPYAMHIWRRY